MHYENLLLQWPALALQLALVLYALRKGWNGIGLLVVLAVAALFVSALWYGCWSHPDVTTTVFLWLNLVVFIVVGLRYIYLRFFRAAI